MCEEKYLADAFNNFLIKFVHNYNFVSIEDKLQVRLLLGIVTAYCEGLNFSRNWAINGSIINIHEHSHEVHLAINTA